MPYLNGRDESLNGSDDSATDVKLRWRATLATCSSEPAKSRMNTWMVSRDRPVAHPVDFQTLLANLGGDLPVEGEDSHQVIEQLWQTADPTLVATVGPRYFGFVVGGSLPASGSCGMAHNCLGSEWWALCALAGGCCRWN